MTLPRINTGTYDKMAVPEQYRTHLRLIQKSHPAIVAVSGLDHPPGGFLFPEWVAFFTGICIRQDYIRTAWSKGLKERAVVIRHAVKNALIPVVTLIGLQLPILVGGTVIMENIFNLPGLGRLLLIALNNRDYPVVSGINLFFATGVVGINLLIDLVYAVLDPRVRYD